MRTTAMLGGLAALLLALAAFAFALVASYSIALGIAETA